MTRNYVILVKMSKRSVVTRGAIKTCIILGPHVAVFTINLSRLRYNVIGRWMCGNFRNASTHYFVVSLRDTVLSDLVLLDE